MKRLDIIQLAVIITAIVAGFRGILYLPNIALGIYFWIVDGLRATNFFWSLIEQLLSGGLYMVFAALLVKNSNTITYYIIDKSEMSEELKLEQSKNNLLYILFVGMGVYNLLRNIPGLLKSLYNYFTDKVSSHGINDLLNPVQKTDYSYQIIETILFIIVIAYAKQLANYFSDKIVHLEEKDAIQA